MDCCKRPKLSDVKLSYWDPSVFYRTQWTKLPAAIFIAYRVVIALYILAFYIALLVERLSSTQGYSLIFLTSIAFIVFVVYVLFAGSVAVIDGCILRKQNNEDLGIRHVIHWLLFNVTINVNFLVSIIYWAVLYQPSSRDSRFFYDFHVHAVTSIVSMVDLFVTAVPVWLFHVVYPMAFLVAYLVLTLIYWGTGNGFVYPFLNYTDNPGLAAGAAVGIFVAIFTMQGCIWAVYKLRMWLWMKCRTQRQGTAVTQPADHEANRVEPVFEI